MTKLSRRAIDPKYFGYYLNNLRIAFTITDNKDDMDALIRDLFTHTEYKMFAKRLEIARRLLDGDDYQTIKNKVKVTGTTIALINNILAEKGEGFRKINKKMIGIEKKHKQGYIERIKNLENPFRRRLLKGK